MIKGVLFDMDGVLVDSEEFIRKAAIIMFKELGLTAHHKDFFEFIGAGEDRFLGGVAEKYKFPFNIPKGKARTYEIYSEIIRGKLSPLPGVHSFIKKCRERDLKIAIATSADRTKMESNLKEIGLPESIFDAAVNALDVEKQKPFPDIYLKAAEKIFLRPEECLVVEDAVNGVKAAKTAGARCLGLTTSFSEKELAGADWFAATLDKAGDEVLDW